MHLHFSYFRLMSFGFKFYRFAPVCLPLSRFSSPRERTLRRNFMCTITSSDFVVFPPIQSNGFNYINFRSAFSQRSTVLLPPVLASMAEDGELGKVLHFDLQTWPLNVLISQFKDFVCPRCSEGFIEEINDNNTPPSERERDPADPIYSILHRLMADSISSPGRTRAQGASRRVRSRSPRMVMMSSMSRDDQPSASTASFYRQHLVDSTVHFDLDDFMSTFLSSPRSNPVNERRLEELPKETITDELSSTQCSICFDEFKVAESCVRKLPCNHLFHQNCIFPWLRINGTCPVCRARLNIGTNEADNSTETTPQPSFGEQADDTIKHKDNVFDLFCSQIIFSDSCAFVATLFDVFAVPMSPQLLQMLLKRMEQPQRLSSQHEFGVHSKPGALELAHHLHGDRCAFVLQARGLNSERIQWMGQH